MNTKRIARHLLVSRNRVRRAFPVSVMTDIRKAIHASEKRHHGQICFAVENALDWRRLMRDVPSSERALEVFSRLRVWDTAENNGVLIYLLLADHHVEIVADRGIHGRIGSEGWLPICRLMEKHFLAGRFREGVLIGVDAIAEMLAGEYPHMDGKPNELPDEPVIVS